MRTRLRQWGPGLLLLSPSLILLAIFVYGLIGWTINLSLQDKHNALPSKGFVGLDNYTNLFTNDISDRFVHSLKNLGVFTVVFIGGTHRCSACCGRSCSSAAPGPRASSAPSTCSRWRCRSSPPAWCGAG